VCIPLAVRFRCCRDDVYGRPLVPGGRIAQSANRRSGQRREAVCPEGVTQYVTIAVPS